MAFLKKKNKSFDQATCNNLNGILRYLYYNTSKEDNLRTTKNLERAIEAPFTSAVYLYTPILVEDGYIEKYNAPDDNSSSEVQIYCFRITQKGINFFEIRHGYKATRLSKNELAQQKRQERDETTAKNNYWLSRIGLWAIILGALYLMAMLITGEYSVRQILKVIFE